MAKFAFSPRRPRANLAAITSMQTRMNTYPVTLLQLSILTATRAVAAGGLALLFSGKVGAELRKGIGWNLFGVGATTYVLLVMDLLLRNRTGDA